MSLSSTRARVLRILLRQEEANLLAAQALKSFFDSERFEFDQIQRERFDRALRIVMENEEFQRLQRLSFRNILALGTIGWSGLRRFGAAINETERLGKLSRDILERVAAAGIVLPEETDTEKGSRKPTKSPPKKRDGPVVNEGTGTLTVGLDIGSSSVKLVQLASPAESGWAYDLVKLGVEDLAPGAIVGGVFKNPDALDQAVTRLFKALDIGTRDVALGFSGDGLHWPIITLPHLSPEAFTESIHWEAEQYIVFPLEEVECVYEVLDDAGPGGEMTVQLVAVKKDKMKDRADLIGRAGKNLARWDLDLFALQRCHEINYEEDPGRVVALLNVGASLANLNVVKGQRCIFSREFTLAGQISPENVATEVHKTSELFRGTSGQHIDQILLSGGAAKTPGLREVLGERLKVPVDILDPFRKIRCDPKVVDPNLVRLVGPAAAVAVGLAAELAARRVAERRNV